jgi:iron complex outermembrane recepter protein
MRYLLFAGVFICWSALMAQNSWRITGVVTDGPTGQPLSNVLVWTEPDSITFTTTLDGTFRLAGLTKDAYGLNFKCPGYVSTSKKVVMPAGDKWHVSETLFPVVVVDLQEYTVEETRIAQDVITHMPYIQTTITKTQIDETSARDLGDLMRSSQNISGIRKGGVNIDPVVRGFKFSQLNVHLNGGMKIEGGCPNRMDPTTSHVELEDIQSVEVLKGPYGLRYGPAMGAMVHLKTYEEEPDPNPFVRIKAMMGYESNWNGNRLYLSASAGKKIGFITISGSRKDYGNYRDGYGELVSSSFEKNNIRVMAGIRPWKNHLLRFATEVLNGRNIRFPALPMDERSDDTRLYTIHYHIKSIPGFFDFMTVNLHRSNVIHEMDNKQRPLSDTVVAFTIVDAVNQGGRFETGFKAGEGKMIAGVDFEVIQKDGDRTKNFIRQPGLPVHVETIWNHAHIINTGLFAQYNQQFGSLDLVASARLDMNRSSSDEISVKNPMQSELYHYGTDSIRSEYINFSFNAGATQKLHENWALSFAFGRGTRSPDMTERFIVLLPIGYDRFDYLGDPQLKPETNHQADLTLKFTSITWGSFQLNGFYSIVTGYITGKILPPAVQKPLTAGVLGVKQFQNSGTAHLRGFELMYATPDGKHLGANISAALTKGTLNEAVQYILNDAGQVVDDRVIENDPLTEIPPFDASLVLYCKLVSGKLVPKLNLRAVAPQNHVSEAFYELKTPGFVLAGLSVNYRYNSSLTITVGVNNIFDQGYYEHLNRAVVGSTGNLTEPGRSFYMNLFFKI